MQTKTIEQKEKKSKRLRDQVRTYRMGSVARIRGHICPGCMRPRRNYEFRPKAIFCDKFCEELYRLYMTRHERKPWEEARSRFFVEGALGEGSRKNLERLIDRDGNVSYAAIKIGPLESGQYEPPCFQ